MRSRLALTVALVSAWIGTAGAQSIDTTLWVANGDVYTVLHDGGTIYLGGSFTRVGPATGGGVILDAGSGAPKLPHLLVSGNINAVVADGAGGWFIGGAFSAVRGQARPFLAQVDSTGNPTSWNPAGAGNTVNALALNNGVLYVAGSFIDAGGQLRNRIAALNATTGAVLPWNPNANGSVSALAVAGSTVYAAGAFTTIGGQTRNRIAALDVSTGLATSWDPNAGAAVNTLAIAGGLVYAGGTFTTIGGQTRNRIAALDAGTGLATAWDPNANNLINVLAVSGSTIYVGGAFGNIGGQGRNSIAALDASTGLATGWNPSVVSGGGVFALLVSGGTIYAGGSFINIGGQPRFNLAALDSATGAATAWSPSMNNQVSALAIQGGRVFVGGVFTSLNATTRNHIAALDAATGTATAWNPNADFDVYALVRRGNTLYVGGGFSTIGGQPRNRVAALDVTTGSATSWAANANGNIETIALNGNTVYVGGGFTSIGGQGRNYLAALDATTGAVATGWSPDPGSNVSALATIGNSILAGGFFSTIGGATRHFIAALDSATGTATAWNPDANNSVRALATRGDTVYVGGVFTTIGGQTRNRLAALDASSGNALAWNPNISNGTVVRTIALSGSTVYAGGLFITVGGQNRSDAAAIDATTGVVLPWSPVIHSAAQVLSISVGGGKAHLGGHFFYVSPRPQSFIAALAAVPDAQAVAPSSGGNAGTVTVVVSGHNLWSGATVRLRRSGQPDIPGNPVSVAADGMSLTATFDLAGEAVGAWDVVVTNPDAQTATLANGFTITAVLGPQLRVNVIGPPQIRAGRRYPYDLVIENPGNVDAVDVPLWLTGIPTDATLELDFPLAYPPQAGGEPDWTTVPLAFSSPGGRYLDVVLPRVPPGTTVRRVYLTVPATPSFKLRTAVTPPWINGTVFRGCLVNGGISSPTCMGVQLTAINAILAGDPSIQAMSGIGMWAKIAWQCESPGSLPVALTKAEQVLDFMVGPVESPATALVACSDVLPPRWSDSLTVTIVGAIDPNDKLGSRDSISTQQAIPYSIRFENSPNASAPAQNVVISDPLNVTWLNPATVSLGDITFGGLRIAPPPGLSTFSTTVDLRPGRNLLVNVAVGLDPIGHALSWSFVSIDPATGHPTTDPLAGFLPPNVTPPEGEGSVLFTVLPQASLPGGTTIRNHANIKFDDNASTATNDWANTVDGTAPASHVQPLSAQSSAVSIPVSWTADGSPADLRDFTLYVKEDSAPYRVWRQNTTATSDTLMPPGNHQPHSYAFYSVARDIAGNIEASPSGSDATTVSRLGVGDTAPLELALEGARPNPATGPIGVWLSLPDRSPATLDLIDLAGRRVARQEVGVLGPGRHRVPLEGPRPLPPGLYFIRLARGSSVLSARVAVVR